MRRGGSRRNREAAGITVLNADQFDVRFWGEADSCHANQYAARIASAGHKHDSCLPTLAGQQL